VTSEAVLPREQRPAIANYLAERLAAPVSLETWTQQQSALVRTDRDPCTFCDQVATAARQLASLHPGITYTAYDLDRHAGRAAEAGIERPPLTLVRGRGGKELRIVGLWSGVLFPAFLDALIFVAGGVSPVQPETRERLAELDKDLAVEILVAPYDPYSAHMLRLGGALAAESKHVRLEAIEISEFPRLAETRIVREVPMMTINGRRFNGAWDEKDLVEQLLRVAGGDSEPVIRDRVLVAPYMSLDQARELAAREGAGQPPPEAPGGASGLVIPGR
jgi:hypothetical protein